MAAIRKFFLDTFSKIIAGVIVGVILSALSARYAITSNDKNEKPTSAVGKTVYNIGTLIAGSSITNNNVSGNAPAQSPQTAAATPQPVATPAERQQPMRYVTNDFEISNFKVTRDAKNIILTFAIWNKTNEIVYILENRGKGFTLSSDGGIAEQNKLQNLESTYGSSTSKDSYTPISKGSTIYVSVEFPADKVKGKIGDFNFNLAQLKNERITPHTFSEQLPLPPEPN